MRKKKKRTGSSGRRKLRPGVHCVRIKKQGTRKVRVLKSGKWRFLKGKCRKR